MRRVLAGVLAVACCWCAAPMASAEPLPWLDSASAGAAAGLAGVKLLAAKRAVPADEGAVVQAGAELAAARTCWRAQTRFTFGARGPLFDLPEPSIAPPNAMDEFLDAVERE